MGYKISWIGFQGQSKPQVLDLIGGTDTEVVDEANEADFSVAEIPDAWTMLFSNDFDFVSEKPSRSCPRAAALSRAKCTKALWSVPPTAMSREDNNGRCCTIPKTV